MKTSRLIGALCAVIFAVITMSSHAALVGRDLDGNLTTAEAYYDTDANLTWLANANAAGTTMNWANANAWAAGLDIDGTAGADGWRLPASDTCVEYNCTGSEMGNLFYNVLGNTAGSLSNTGPFSNVQSGEYWSSTEYAPNAGNAWRFFFDDGYQNDGFKILGNYGWAVQSGDVGAAVVPVPAALWLFGSGLLALVGLGKQRRR